MPRRLPLTAGSLFLCAALAIADGLPPISQRFADVPPEGPYPESPNFQRHVTALLGRLGCNGRNCHGSFQGRGGFRLSMFGHDFTADHQALAGGEHPRCNVKNPSESLILNKPTNADVHEGGKRYDQSEWQYRVLRAWIAAGSRNDSSLAGSLQRLEVTPAEIVFDRPGQSLQLQVVAHWSDGTREDVTCLTRFHANDDTIAEVSPDGQVTARGRGDTNIIASYDNGVAPIAVLMPLNDRIGPRYPKVETPTEIDRLVVQKLKKLGIVPSPVCTDEEFLRRASLDIAGTLPTPAQIGTFVSDNSPDKRTRKIDELLQTPAYALWWSTKFCDITGLNGPLYLGTTEFGPIVSEQWRSWLERKFRDNVPYDKIVAGMVVAVSRPEGQGYLDYSRAQSAYVRSKDPLDFTARETMPHFWFRRNLSTADEKALAFAYSFMGVRLDCAQCHKHPFDRWSQQDFKQFAAVFDRVRWGVSPECQSDYDKLRDELGVAKMKNAAERRQSYWRWAKEGKAAPWPEVFIARGNAGAGKDATDAKPEAPDTIVPKILGDAEIDLESGEDPRRPLMDWLRRRDNPYFARAFVNRVWSHYFGRGIVEPADDLNLGNPPTNIELLNYLATQFVDQGYDMKWLHREIVGSAAYQRSFTTNGSNIHDERHFSRAAVRRLPAEVAIDAMLLATATGLRAASYLSDTKDRKIGVQATADHSRTEFALAVFGKPLRTINCDCEREQDPSLAQAIFVRNDRDLHAMLDRREGWLAEIAKDKNRVLANPVEPWIVEAFQRTLSRSPTTEESARAARHIAAATTPLDGLRDLLWALLNTHEFITNH